MELSIVIVNYNTYELLNNLLKNLNSVLLNLNINYEIIIIDNSAVKKSIFPRTGVKILSMKKNIGFTKALNLGIFLARGKYILIVTPDVEIPPKTIQRIIRYINGNNLILNKFIIGFNIIDGYSYSIDSIGGTLDYKTGLPIVYKRFHSRYVLYPGGAIMLIKKELLRSLGYYDPVIFAYNDEVDLGIKAWLKGYGVIIDRDLIVYHYPKSSFGMNKELLKLREHLIIRNLFYIWVKYFSLVTILFFIFNNIMGLLTIQKGHSNSNKNIKIISKFSYHFPYILKFLMSRIKYIIIFRFNLPNMYNKKQYQIIRLLMRMHCSI